MKTPIILFLLLSIIGRLTAAIAPSDIESKLREIDQLVGVDAALASRKSAEAAKLMYAYIAATGRSNRTDPTPEALRRAHDLYALLDDARVNNLMAVSNKCISTVRGDPYGPLSLLVYAKPTDELRSSLLAYANENKNRGVEGTSYLTIFNLGLDTEEIRINITERLINTQWGSGSDGLLLEVINYYPVPEAIPFLKAALSNETPTLARIPASTLAQASINLGPDAKELLPLLEKRLSEILNAGNEPQLAYQLNEAIEVLNGSRPPKQFYSINGAGRIKNGHPQKIEIKDDGYYVAGVKIFASRTPVESNNIAVISAKKVTDVDTKKHNYKIYALGLIIIVAVVATLVVSYKKRKF